MAQNKNQKDSARILVAYFSATVIPFATSGGSTLAHSAAALKKSYPALNWKEGRLLNRADEKTIRAWLEKLSVMN